MRISATPVIRAGSSDSGSLPLTITRSAGGSFLPQPASKNAARKKRQPFFVTRRNPLRQLGRGWTKFIGGYLAGAGVLVTAGLVTGAELLVLSSTGAGELLVGIAAAGGADWRES